MRASRGRHRRLCKLLQAFHRLLISWSYRGPTIPCQLYPPSHLIISEEKSHFRQESSDLAELLQSVKQTSPFSDVAQWLAYLNVDLAGEGVDG